LKYPKGDEVLGVDVGIGVEKSAELSIRVGPWKTRAGDTGRYNVIVKVGPGLAAR